LKKRHDIIARQSVGRPKDVCSPLVDMDDPPLRRLYPKAAIAIPQDPEWPDVLAGHRQPIHKLRLPVHKSSESPDHRDQQRAVALLSESLNAVGCARHGKEFLRTWLPSP